MKYEEALFAGGCFWGMQDLFRHLPGVIDSVVGYCGGSLRNPTYNDLKNGDTGHAETLKIIYDPTVISYEKLLRFFFQIHDPTTFNQQGNDKGTSYRSIIFYLNEDQKMVADQLLTKIEDSGKWPGPIVTELVSAPPFYPAEPEHQDYLQRYPQGYTCHWIRSNWTLKDN